MNDYRFTRYGDAFCVRRKEDDVCVGTVKRDADGKWLAMGHEFRCRREAAEYLMERAR